LLVAARGGGLLATGDPEVRLLAGELEEKTVSLAGEYKTAALDNAPISASG